jgi:endonuclease YncB( thermonuclease family)
VKSNKKILIWLSATFLVLGLMGCDKIFPSSGYKVQRVSDGDTLTVTDAQNQKITVRFACIDAPEVPHSQKERESKRLSDRNQFQWGEKAQKRVQELVNKGGDRVQLNITDSDRYGRKVAEIRLKDGTFIQEVLVREGLAKVYRNYLNKCPSKDIIQQAETTAQKKRQGVWQDSKYVNAWEFRQLK